MTIKFWIYVVPLPLFALMWGLWFVRTSNYWFSCYVMILPLVYGYLVPGISANILKKWQFKGRFLLGNIFLHHGFIYASKMSAFLFLVFWGLPLRDYINSATGVAVVTCSGVLHGYMFWLQDIRLLRAGIVEIYSSFAQHGESPEEIAFRYAPRCFFFLGATYATSCVLAFNEIVINRNENWPTMLWLFAAGLMMMLLLPSLSYGIAEKRWKAS